MFSLLYLFVTFSSTPEGCARCQQQTTTKVESPRYNITISSPIHSNLKVTCCYPGNIQCDDPHTKQLQFWPKSQGVN